MNALASELDFPSTASLQMNCDSAPTVEELVSRAKALRPLLLENQDEAEKLARPTPDVQQALINAGFYNILTPKLYGGWEMGPWAFISVALEVARGDPGTAWCYALGHGHVFSAAAYFPKVAQDEVFTKDDGYFCAASFGYTRGSATRVDGGYKISGDWPYSSGSPYSNYYLGSTPAPAGSPHAEEGQPIYFMVHRDDYEMLDDWHGVLGLRASGSQTTRLKDAFVPDHRIIGGSFSALGAGDDTPGYEIHGNSFFRTPQLAFSSTYGIAVIIGGAYAALDEYERVMKTKAPQQFEVLGTDFKVKVQAQMERYQRDYALARGLIDTAYAALHSIAADVAALGNAGGGMKETYWINLRLFMCADIAWKAVQDYLWPTSGSSQARSGKRMERYYRDLSMIMNSPATAYREPVAIAAAQMEWSDFLEEMKAEANG